MVAIDAAQIVEVHLVSLLSLPIIQAQFFCHLVCEDASSLMVLSILCAETVILMTAAITIVIINLFITHVL